KEMDLLFRRADFAAEVPDLEERLWCRIMNRIREEKQEEYALEDDALGHMAAAAGTALPAQVKMPRKKWQAFAE
ncbi:MAG: hypothetical protein IJ812_08030, partial [Schwartzia sp.]|nr:hypothetical protein [Schwartzia sp. (in: firmicutes)]